MKHTPCIHVTIDITEISLTKLCRTLREITQEIEQSQLGEYQHYYDKQEFTSSPIDFCTEYEYSIETNSISTSYQ